MANEPTAQTGDLQFETAVPRGAAAGAPAGAALGCHYCKRPMRTEYYDVSGHPACANCRGQIERLLETPPGAGPFVKAALFGLAAAVAGAILYYAVVAITHFEIGIVAIVIGYMVGYAVRRGAGGRGGRRFQVLAIVLTYIAVGLAYMPIVIRAATNDRPAAQASAATPAGEAVKPRPSPVKAAAVLAGLVFALPVLIVTGGLPTSLISGAIIFFGMQQAWRMTGAPRLQISGPYRVGDRPVSAT